VTLPLADEMDTTTPNIQKVYTKVNLREQKSDFAYWQAQPYQVRLAKLEQIRREFHQWRYGAEPRFQRVYSIIKTGNGPKSN
jgi:hypothetical protein